MHDGGTGGLQGERGVMAAWAWVKCAGGHMRLADEEEGVVGWGWGHYRWGVDPLDGDPVEGGEDAETYRAPAGYRLIWGKRLGTLERGMEELREMRREVEGLKKRVREVERGGVGVVNCCVSSLRAINQAEKVEPLTPGLVGRRQDLLLALASWAAAVPQAPRGERP